MKNFIKKLNDTKTWDYEISLFDLDELVLLAGQDLAYPTQKIIFKSVSYIDLPTLFHHASFREINQKELEVLSQKVGISPDDRIKICICAESCNSIEEANFYIFAQDIEIVELQTKITSSQNH